MKKKPKQPAMGIVQVFIDNGKVVFHPDKGKVVKWVIPEPRDFGVYGCPDLPKALRDVVLMLARLKNYAEIKTGRSLSSSNWRPVTGFVWCGWGWEMRVQKITK